MVKRKTKRKAKSTRRRCTSSGCRKLQVGDTAFCKTHAPEAEDGGQPDDKVVKLSSIDALRFGKADAEMRNAMQGIELIDYRITDLLQSTKVKVSELRTKKALLETMVGNHKASYQELVRNIADTYGIPDPAQMAIDPDNGTVRDLRKL